MHSSMPILLPEVPAQCFSTPLRLSPGLGDGSCEIYIRPTVCPLWAAVQKTRQEQESLGPCILLHPRHSPLHGSGWEHVGSSASVRLPWLLTLGALRQVVFPSCRQEGFASHPRPESQLPEGREQRVWRVVRR